MVTFKLIFNSIFHCWRKTSVCCWFIHKDCISSLIVLKIQKDLYSSSFPRTTSYLQLKQSESSLKPTENVGFGRVSLRRASYLGLSLDAWLCTTFRSTWLTGVLHRKRSNSRKNLLPTHFFMESTAVGIWLMFQSMQLGSKLSGEHAEEFIGIFNPEWA